MGYCAGTLLPPNGAVNMPDDPVAILPGGLDGTDAVKALVEPV